VDAQPRGHGATALRQKQLDMDPPLVRHTYDAQHVRAIHRHLVRDVMEGHPTERPVQLPAHLVERASG